MFPKASSWSSLHLVGLGGFFVALPSAEAALNVGLDRLESVIEAKVSSVRDLIWVDTRHLEDIMDADHHEDHRICTSSDGPCSFLQRRFTKDWLRIHQAYSLADSLRNGVLPLSFLGRNTIDVDRWQQQFLDSVVAAEGTTDDEVTLNDRLRTLHRITEHEKYPGGELLPRRMHYGRLNLSALYDQWVREPARSDFNVDFPIGSSSTWEGAWTLGGDASSPSAHLLGGLGYVRFNKKMLITSLPMRPCGAKPVQRVLVVGRQGLSVVWDRIISLSECSTPTGWYDFMEFNQTLLSIDELMIVGVLGREVCLGSFQMGLYPQRLEINDDMRVQIPVNPDEGIQDINHQILLLYPGSIAQRNVWNFQAISVSTSALGRLVSVRSALEDGLRLKTFSEPSAQCLHKSNPSHTEASRLGKLLLHGDEPRYSHEPPRAPDFSNTSRTELSSVLDSILRTPSGTLGTWANDLTQQATTAYEALRNCEWKLEGQDTCGVVPIATAKKQQRALDTFIAALFQEKQLEPEHLWTPHDTVAVSEFEVLEEITVKYPKEALAPSNGVLLIDDDGCAVTQTGSECVATSNEEAKFEADMDLADETKEASDSSAISEALIVFSCLVSSLVIVCGLRSRRRVAHASPRKHTVVQ